jgi:hypothetical protein
MGQEFGDDMSNSYSVALSKQGFGVELNYIFVWIERVDICMSLFEDELCQLI